MNKDVQRAAKQPSQWLKLLTKSGLVKAISKITSLSKPC